jgi:acyl carrier protein
MAELSKILELVESAGVVPNMAAFDPDKSFRNNGVDSLDVMNILLVVEEGLDIKFSEDEAGRIDSVAKMIEVLDARGA